eukprot:TRINITY_DN12412_c0_g1_i1.p1 TRINITY_DN12412_c0_g1~~TRINITY_DN12412_c0_g1_i1.p1  ORF type:complete len:153 (+),score=41.76 TRINITY_DN12412_c0_g1_i1:43-501(+)
MLARILSKRSKNLTRTPQKFPIAQRTFHQTFANYGKIIPIDTVSQYEGKIRSASFDDVVLVKVSADWCRPCKEFDPRLKKIMERIEYKNINLVEVDVDNEELLDIFEKETCTSSVPHILAYGNGKIIDDFVGAVDDEAFIDWLNDQLEKFHE